ncbi:MAG: hexitol phosphatase HxpB [Labilithrix sp.]|nr:hexitol phosphatase HxpB [Labilithrix sp.]
MIGAVIFDMDGLLVDSEPLWVESEIEVFGEVGVVLREEDCAQTKGLRVDDVVGHWYGRRPWNGPSRADVEATLIARVASRVRERGVALPGVSRAIEIAKGGGRPIALASSSPSAIIGAALERLDLGAAFDVVQSAETEALGKPHPGIFLRTAERLGVPPTRCLVLEDSLTGLVAAKAARMACVVVPFDHPDHDPRFVLADAILGSLEAFDEALIAALDRARR